MGKEKSNLSHRRTDIFLFYIVSAILISKLCIYIEMQSKDKANEWITGYSNIIYHLSAKMHILVVMNLCPTSTVFSLQEEQLQHSS